MLNDTFRHVDGELHCDAARISDITADTGTPVYIYSFRRALHNLERLRRAFSRLNAHIHYSIKANGNLALLRTLAAAGAGMDAVSGGEIYRALLAGAPPDRIVFAGVGKTAHDLIYGLQQRVGWFNIENLEECALLNDLAGGLGQSARVALRLNPDVQANTHRHIATGHGSAKFGLSADVAATLLARQADFPHLRFEGLHVHIGSQLGDTAATVRAVEAALELIAPYPAMRTVNVGGGLPVAYHPDDARPEPEAFAAALEPLLQGYHVLLEPGRSIIADAGILVTRVLYVKQHGGETFVITDAGMTELIRPALYEARHDIVAVVDPPRSEAARAIQIAGPVCETADVLARDIRLAAPQPGDLLAVLTTGAYGMVMASNYNARPRPAEVAVMEDGLTWRIVRRRETWDDLVRLETDLHQP